jgi:GNAT superfamily N-acetyltransferase
MTGRNRVRPAVPADAPVLASLCSQLGYPSTDGQVAGRLADILSRPDHAVFVTEVDGQTAGWIHVFVCHMLEAEAFTEVGGLVVDEGWRGLGLGRALMAEAEGWSLERGVLEVRLCSNVIREGAHRFYESLGYARVKSQHTFRKHLLPVLLHAAQ